MIYNKKSDPNDKSDVMGFRICNQIRKAKDILLNAWCKKHPHAKIGYMSGGYFFFEQCSADEVFAAQMLLSLEGWKFQDGDGLI